ncbi:hypothetical protein SODG_006332 [Sodalis praecaptivus]
MTPVLVSSLEEAERLLAAGLVKHVELGFELTSDKFFHFASYWCERGAKIKKIISILSSRLRNIPSRQIRPDDARLVSL